MVWPRSMEIRTFGRKAMEKTALAPSVKTWEWLGVAFITVCGSVLHFVYGWAGRPALLGLVVPVNESVWEHLKLGFTSLILSSAVEYPFIRRRVRGFAMGKLLGILSMEAFIVIVFYSYTAVLGYEILAVDIGSFVAGAALCQLTAMSWMRGRTAKGATGKGSWTERAGVAGLALIAALFMLFTYVTPRLPIFRDSNTGEYGAVWGAAASR